MDQSEELDQLRKEIYTSILSALGFWLCCMVLLYRHHRTLRNLRTQDDISVELDEEDGDAQYLISFFTGLKYTQPPSGTVRAHLIGSLYPGRFHDFIHPNGTLLFAPKSREKFVVTEDVPLGRIIAIVLQTEQNGESPTWQCQTVIVRNIQTNDAWYFAVNNEISFPPRAYNSYTQDELTSFKFSLNRRIRREVRQGQYLYFGFWFRTTSSVYRFSQRIVTAITCHYFILALSIVFLGLAFPPDINSAEFSIKKPVSYRVKGIPRGLTDEKVSWIIHAITIGVMVSFFTSCVGYWLVTLFRERNKFEHDFEEMDYVIGTAIHEDKERKLKLVQLHIVEPTNPSDTVSIVSEPATEPLIIEPILEPILDPILPPEPEPIAEEIQNPYNFCEPLLEPMILPTNVEMKSNVENQKSWRSQLNEKLLNLIPILRQRPAEDVETGQQEVETEQEVDLTRREAIKKSDPFTTRERSSAPTPKDPVSGDDTPSSSSSLSIGVREIENELTQHIKARGALIQKESIQEFPEQPCVYYSEEVSKVNIPLKKESFIGTPLEKRARMRLLFVDNNFRSKTVRRSGIQYELTPSVIEHLRRVSSTPTWFGTPVHPVRKWFRPFTAWLYSFFVVTLSSVGIGATVMFSQVQLNGEIEFFFLLLIATLMVSLLIGAFVIETVKIWIVAAVFARGDKGMYERISNRTNRTNQRGSTRRMKK